MVFFILTVFVPINVMIASVIACCISKALDWVIDSFMDITGSYQDIETNAHHCSECENLAQQPVMTNCEHIFCYQCIKQLTHCPVCDTILWQFTGLGWIKKTNWYRTQHAKLWVIVRDVLACWEPTDRSAKGIAVRMISTLLMLPLLLVSLMSLSFVLTVAENLLKDTLPALVFNTPDIKDSSTIFRAIYFLIISIKVSCFLKIKKALLIAQPRVFPKLLA